MRSKFAFAGTVLLLGVVVGFSTARQKLADPSKPVEVAILAESNWDQFVPNGKEVDAIYGDIVLRNGYLTAVIGQPLATRHANMSVRNIAGALIDLTVRDTPSDQLAAYYPGKTDFAYRSVTAHDSAGHDIPLSSPVSASSPHGVSVKADSTDERPEAIVRYQLSPSDRFISVTTTFTNRSQQPQTVSLEDNVRIDGGKEDQTRTPNGTVDHFWLEDRFWGQAYGLDAEGFKLQLTSDQRVTAVKYAGADGMSTVTLSPGQSYQFTRRIYPGANLADVHAIGLNLSPDTASTIQLAVKNQQGRAIPRAQVEFKRNGARYASARTDGNGILTVMLPKDVQSADLFAYGRQIGTSLTLPASASQPTLLTVDFDPGLVQAIITDEQNQAIACKVEFIPLDDGAKLDFGPETGEFALRNLVYTASGKFQQPIPPGKYSVMISHGPEYDAITTELTVPAGGNAPLTAKLIRTVQTPGWVSGDFHSHSSPSGDNTSSQLGRVLNLVAEQIEFAPCTEHNRVTTYAPHIEKLGIGSRMATVSGIELTGLPLPLNHQNAFPMRMTPRTQDGGGPVAGPDLETQIERLGLHDNRSEKLIQVNHPDLGWMFYDKDGDGKSDSGFERAFPFMDVVEVHPIDRVLTLTPTWEVDGKRYHNTIFNWLQLLNQGFRIYGVVNTDAHYNFHGSGWIRNWIQSSTDDPAKIDPMELARATKQGRLIMSNGPYLEVTATETGKSDRFVAGQDMKVSSGKVSLKVRVQCPNWLDVNRLFVLINGRTHSVHDYSREKTPDAFRSGVIKFERTLEIELKEDSHIIVATGDSGGKLGMIYGAMSAKTQPAAMTNPIFVDINGDGFQPNKDTLGHPLPVKNSPGR